MSKPQPELVSVVIAAYNAAETLSRCIDSLLEQSYEALEILILDDGSTDRTAEVLTAHPGRERFTVIRLENGGQSRARNLGVARAQGEWLAFFDADCLLHPRCVAQLKAAADQDLGCAPVAAVGGLQRPPADDSPFGKAVYRYFESIGFATDYVREGREAEVVETMHNPSCNVLYRRAVFEQLGGFDEGLWVGEDPDLDRRATLAGYRLLFQPRAVVYHYRSSSPSDFARKMFAYGRGQMMLVRRYGFHRKIHALPPLALSAATAALVGLWLVPWAATGVLTIAAVVVFIFCERLRRRAESGFEFYRLLYLNLSRWLAGFFAELIRPRLPRKPRYPRSPGVST